MLWKFLDCAGVADPTGCLLMLLSIFPSSFIFLTNEFILLLNGVETKQSGVPNILWNERSQNSRDPYQLLFKLFKIFWRKRYEFYIIHLIIAISTILNYALLFFEELSTKMFRNAGQPTCCSWAYWTVYYFVIHERNRRRICNSASLDMNATLS